MMNQGKKDDKKGMDVWKKVSIAIAFITLLFGPKIVPNLYANYTKHCQIKELLKRAEMNVENQNYDLACIILQNELLADNATAKHNLGYVYAKGYKDIDKAMSFYEEAIVLGDENAYTSMISCKYDALVYSRKEDFLSDIIIGYKDGNKDCTAFLANLFDSDISNYMNAKGAAKKYCELTNEEQMERLLNAEETYVFEDQVYVDADIELYKKSFVKRIEPKEAKYEIIGYRPVTITTTTVDAEDPNEKDIEVSEEKQYAYGWVKYGDVYYTYYPKLELFVQEYEA